MQTKSFYADTKEKIISLAEDPLKLRKSIVTIENMTIDSDLAQYIEQIFIPRVPSFVNFNQCKFNDSEEISNNAILEDVGFSMINCNLTPKDGFYIISLILPDNNMKIDFSNNKLSVENKEFFLDIVSDLFQQELSEFLH